MRTSTLLQLFSADALIHPILIKVIIYLVMNPVEQFTIDCAFLVYFKLISNQITFTLYNSFVRTLQYFKKKKKPMKTKQNSLKSS